MTRESVVTPPRVRDVLTAALGGVVAVLLLERICLGHDPHGQRLLTNLTGTITLT